MKHRNRLVAAIVCLLILGGVLYRWAVTYRPLPPPVTIGPLNFSVVDVSSRRLEFGDRKLPAQQVWITVRINSPDPRHPIESLSVDLPSLFHGLALIGPDGSRQESFWAQEAPRAAWYDEIRKIGRTSLLQASYGFDNKAHWQTATLMTRFDADNGRFMGAEQRAVAGKTLRLGPITLR